MTFSDKHVPNTYRQNKPFEVFCIYIYVMRVCWSVWVQNGNKLVRRQMKCEIRKQGSHVPLTSFDKINAISDT